jgi:hypothetical protein
MWLIKLQTLLMLIFTFELFVEISSPINVSSKIFCSISVSFEFQKFRSHYAKAMLKDKKVNIAVAYFVMTSFPEMTLYLMAF